MVELGFIGVDCSCKEKKCRVHYLSTINFKSYSSEVIIPIEDALKVLLSTDKCTPETQRSVELKLTDLVANSLNKVPCTKS